MTAVVFKAGTLNVSRKNCWILITRDMKPGPNHGKWTVMSVQGFTVIFASKRDAMEFRLVYGGSQFPILANMSDDAYETYLDRFIKLQPYEATGKWEVWGHNVRRGWVPSFAEVLSGSSDSQYEGYHTPARVTVFDERG